MGTASWSSKCIRPASSFLHSERVSSMPWQRRAFYGRAKLESHSQIANWAKVVHQRPFLGHDSAVGHSTPPWWAVCHLFSEFFSVLNGEGCALKYSSLFAISNSRGPRELEAEDSSDL